MQTIARSSFITVKTEGGLLPADVLQRIADSRNLPGLRPEDYHLLPGERLNEAINRAWNRCLGAWLSFAEQRQKLSATDTGTTLTRDRWLLVLFQELGFGRLPILRSGLTAPDGTTYPISHLWEQTPIHLVTFRQPLDRKSEIATQVKRSPHSLLQEFLNRSPDHQWGMIANGLHLRLLRDNASLRRAAYVEFDLEMMMTGELYAEFTLLWLVCHQSRFEVQEARVDDQADGETRRPEAEDDGGDDEPSDPRSSLPTTRLSCWLEQWSKKATDQGTRALAALRDGVKEAIEALGSGFLAHRANESLRRRLRSGELTTNDYYRQLRRLVYRLIFLAVAEDRDLLLLPEADAVIRQRYLSHYSIRRLRELAVTIRGGPHPDLYQQVRLLFVLLREGYPALGVPGLGSFLFSAHATPALDNLEVANANLLAAIRAIAFTVEKGVRRPVDYRNLDSEEPGSVYESLLELHPQINVDAASFALQQGAGSERKTTGSHYTPSSLVECLLDSALEPVVVDRLAQAEAQWRASRDHDSTPLRTYQERALLALKVLDFATGSGHMLIGAGRRLARHLARIRTGDDEPTPEALRAAMREVVRHCLYGVDVNDMAVELCKVALWMETLEPGKPLSFLDAHIQCGNSLIGVTPGLDISEIPDEAFQPVTGDDKAAASALRKRNKREREGQMSLPFQVTVIETLEDLARWRTAQLARLDALDEEGVAQVQRKERAYSAYLTSDQYAKSRLEYDLWTSAFFWPMPVGTDETQPAPTQQALRQVRAGQPIDVELQRQVHASATKRQFFHWVLAFPEVFNNEIAGFDVILSNPPWERIKLQEKEWFAVSYPDIAAASSAAVRKEMIKALKSEDPAIYNSYLQSLNIAENESHFIRNSKHYPLCGRGDVNTYAIFAELAQALISGNGQAGIVVPSGIATNDTYKAFFDNLMYTGAIKTFYDFLEIRDFFVGTDSRESFCLMTIRGNLAVTNMAAVFIFNIVDINEIREIGRQVLLNHQDISLVNPNTRTLPKFQTERDADLTKQIYGRLQVLIKESPSQMNSWNARFITMFHMSNDSYLFCTRKQLESEEWQLRRNHFLRNGEAYLPLYEAKMMNQFNHRFGTYEQANIRDTVVTEYINVKFLPYPRYWIEAREVGRRVGQTRQWFIGFRDITNSASERTVLVCILPFAAMSNKIPLVFLTDCNATKASCLVASLNSFVLDYTARQKIGGNSLNFFILKQFPVLLPVDFNRLAPWQPELNIETWISSRTLELTYTAWDLQPFARACGYDGPPFRWDEERRFLLRCELDAAYFHLYGIARDDVEYIMETFPIVKRKDIQKHGNYRTKRVILAIYDAMSEAMRAGVAYQTRLDPPPADSRVAHPP